MYSRNCPRQPAKPVIDARRTSLPDRRLALAFGLLMFFSTGAPQAQGRSFTGAGQRRLAQQGAKWRQKRIQGDKHNHPPNFFRRLRNLPPGEQERILQNDAAFHRLPVWRQQRIRQNLRRWNALSPQQKQVIRQRQRILRSLSPAQRKNLQRIFPQYRRLSPPQRAQVMTAFRRLRNMPPAARRRLLSNPQFQQRFTPQQRHILRGLNRLLPQ